MGKIMKFLAKLRTKNAEITYKSAIKKYLRFIYGGELESRLKDDNEMEIYEKFAERYFAENRKYGEDLVNFAVFLTKQNVAPKTANTYLSAIRTWLTDYDIEIPQKYLKEVNRRKPEGDVRLVEDELTREKLAKIIRYCEFKKNYKMKALILVLLSSGMRIGEATSIRLSDLRLDNDPPEIILRQEYTKKKRPREVFITKQAKEALLVWLDHRDKYLEEKIKRIRNLKKIKKRKFKIKVEKLEDLKKDDRVFPFTENEAEQEFVKILKEVGLYRRDPSTGMTTIRLHTLRKWFKTTLLDSGVPSELTEIYLGHYSKKLELAYSKFRKDQRRQWYKKVEPVLTIPTEDKELERKLKEREEELKRKKEEMDKILQQKIKELEFEAKKEIEKVKDLILDHVGRKI